MSLRDVQAELAAMGHDPGAHDARWGPQTERAALAALAELRALRSAENGATGLVAQQPVAKRTISEIIVHCTATPEGRAVSVDEIRAWHMARGWRDVGYHYVVMLDGRIEAGRPEAEIGAHCYGHNEGTLGVVYVGGVAADGVMAKDTRTPAQTKALMAIVRALYAKYQGITMVSGHNDHTALKACPSFKVGADPLSRIPAEI